MPAAFCSSVGQGPSDPEQGRAYRLRKHLERMEGVGSTLHLPAAVIRDAGQILTEVSGYCRFIRHHQKDRNVVLIPKPAASSALLALLCRKVPGPGPWALSAQCGCTAGCSTLRRRPPC